MARMKNTARKDGRVKASVYIGLDADGKKKYKYVYADNNKELEQKVSEVKARLGKGIDVTADRDSFDFWRRKWLKFKAADVSENWHKALTINSAKLDPISFLPIIKLRALDLQDILVDLAADGYSKRVIKSVRDIAIGVMEFAIENRVIEFNPFACTKIPANTKTEEKRRALTLEEQSWIVNTPHRAQLPAMIMMYAGLRRGELFALTWQDINLEAGTITVSKSVVMHNGKPEIKSGGKTKSAERVVYIPKRLVDYLRDQPHTSLFVCPTAEGKLMSDSAWRRLWDSYMCDLNIKYGLFPENNKPKSKFQPGGVDMVIPPFTAHWLRHTFVTNMYMAGVDVAVARDQAGHSDIKTTLDIYTTLDKECRKTDMSKVDSYIGENTSAKKKSSAG